VKIGLGNLDSVRSSPCQLCGSGNSRVYYYLPAGVYKKCKNCGLVAVDPHPNFDKMLSEAIFWANSHHTSPEKVAQHYDRNFQEIAFKDFLDMANQYKQSGRLLDVGCGIGGFVDAAQNAGWDAYGTDISPSIRIPQERGLKVFQGQIGDLDLPDQYFDVITLFDVIEHISDLSILMADIHRFLRPSGGLFVVTPNLDSIPARLLGSKWSAIEPQDHITLFTPTTLSKFLIKHNFTPVQIITRDINWLGLKYAFTSPPSLEERKRRQKENRRLIGNIVRNPFLINARRLVNFFFAYTQLGEKLIVEAKANQI
jgi:2-polyprenyl-3-methyl-5-hydroxy-6-metoxy-1,4-benzoquinol methylase